jgi:hypothetical protein
MTTDVHETLERRGDTWAAPSFGGAWAVVFYAAIAVVVVSGVLTVLWPPPDRLTGEVSAATQAR